MVGIIYWFWVILAVYVWIMHVIRIHNKIERMWFAVRNFTWIGYYYKTSVSWYWWRVPNPKINWTIIRKPGYFWVIIKNVLIWPWFSRIFIIKKIVWAIDELDYSTKMPDKLKEILNTIYEHDLPKDEMLKLIEEINKIHYHGYYFIPQDVRTEEEKKKDERWKVIFKDWDASIEVSNSWTVCFKNYGSNSIINTYNSTIEFKPDSNSYVFLDSTDEYKILDWNHVEIRCIEFRDYNPESRREKNDFEYKPIENGVVYESRIVEDETHKLAWMKDKKLMKEYIEKEIDSYKRKAQWRKANWWISTAVLYANLNKKDFRKYIEIQLEKAKCAILHLENLCEKYWFTLEFNKEWYYNIPELRSGKNKKKIDEFHKEYKEIIGDDDAICSRATIKMLEKYLKEDK